MIPVNPLASALHQMQAMASQAANAEPPDSSTAASASAGPTNFAQALQQSIKDLNDRQAQVGGEAQAFELGARNVSLHAVAIDGAKANIQLQYALQIRNKLVSAYTDIMKTSL